MRVIYSLCDYSGTWSQPYEDAGYIVRRFDLKHGHDVRLLEKSRERVHGILCAPPCDHFAVSGARWWKDKGEQALLEALAIVDACARAVYLYRPVWDCLENPIGRLRRYYGKPRLIFNPCDYGGYGDERDAYTKRTCLWGNFNTPSLKPVEPVMYERGGKRGSWQWANLGGNSERTKELRSITPRGFARAFFEANQ